MLLDLVAQGDIQELEICKCSTLIIHLLCKRHIHPFQTKTNKQTNNIKKKNPQRTSRNTWPLLWHLKEDKNDGKEYGEYKTPQCMFVPRPGLFFY